mmetsp:Transcript_13860/g.28604  ORF Transcript_13860/g.28604 Transcript_13860/m.28604 type:complete len:334 (+) Transcript_13860:78-1079(+)
MKFGSVAAIFLSLSVGAQARPEIANVDPGNYVAKEVDADLAEGGIRKLKDQGVLSFKRDEGALNKRKGNLRKLYFDDDHFYNGNGATGTTGTGFDDDQLVTEELLTIEYYQDNRFSNPAPIWADPSEQTAFSAGNRWLYANVPLQPIFGINDLPIQGLAQGFCEALDEAGNGFCHFTYEFFELNNGAIVVYASITAEGTTMPQGASTMNILGGTGEFSGAAGEITLVPVGIDESIVPARIFKDGSMFLGNQNGYDAKFDVSVRYLINEPPPVPVPVQMPVPAPVASQVTVATTSLERVVCPGQVESEYCDCDLDCSTGSSRCACAEGATCCAR